MRDYLNSILSLIGASSLTDEEFGDITVTDPEDDQAVYDQLLITLEARESVSTTISRLKFYFQAKGLSLEEPNLAKSNIFIGSVLE